MNEGSRDPKLDDALRRIARGTFVNATGNAQPITKVDLINIARDACYEAGIIWSKRSGGGPVVRDLMKPGDTNV